MTGIFKAFGGGDVMTGMSRMTYGFAAIIALIVIICLFVAIRNYLDERKKNSVSLKSQTAERKAEQRKKGLFNYGIIDGDEGDMNAGLDPTDPANQKGRGHANAGGTPRKGLKPVKATLPSKASVPKVGLKPSHASNDGMPAPTAMQPVMPVMQSSTGMPSQSYAGMPSSTAMPQSYAGMAAPSGMPPSAASMMPAPQQSATWHGGSNSDAYNAVNAPGAPVVEASFDDTDFALDQQPPQMVPQAPAMPAMQSAPAPVVPSHQEQVPVNPFETTITPESLH